MGVGGVGKWAEIGYQYCIDALFPKRCFGCGAWDTFLCDSCAGRMPLHLLDECLLCQGRGGQGGHICPRCAPKSALDGLIAATYFHEGVAQKLVHHMKFGGGRDIAKLHCAPAMISCLCSAEVVWITESLQGIIPVPLHPYREAERGYNQARILCEGVALELGVPVYDCMRKTKNTRPQARKTRAQRMEVSHGVYGFDFSGASLPQSVLLVDDVCTTGSTLQACARRLKLAGVARVYGCVFARD